VTFIMVNLSDENYKHAIEVYLAFKSSCQSSQIDNQTSVLLNLALDACRIFIVDCLIYAVKSGLHIEKSLFYLNMAATLCVLTLESSDNHFKQAVIYIERL